jgi:hypothetical protein
MIYYKNQLELLELLELLSLSFYLDGSVYKDSNLNVKFFWFVVENDL